ncbi:hypothetical protein [Microcella frigidaquae]|nr:hypothetical protein [Microcella frigidaquae]NHN45107.1 hypothetical protein [Microcella frigidaquae]
MKSTSGASKDQWFLTGEFTVDRIGKDRKTAEGITAVLGFQSEAVTHEQVTAEIARVDARRARLLADLAALVNPSGVDVRPQLAQIQDRLDAVPTAVQNGQAARAAIVNDQRGTGA